MDINMNPEKQKKEEDEQVQKLKLAKTGQPITIIRSYEIIGRDGRDTDKRFVRKEDAEKYLKKYDK